MKQETIDRIFVIVAVIVISSSILASAYIIIN